MNSIIDNKIFELSTKKENFELVYDINQSYNTIIERLKKEFRQELFYYLKTNISNLIVTFHENDGYISLQDKSWDYFKLYIEWADDGKIDYGIYTDGLKYKKNIELVFQNLRESEMFTDFDAKTYEDMVCYYTKYNYDFTKLSGLKRLLPETRIELFHEFTKSLEKLYERMNPELLEIEKKIAKRTES